MRRMTYLVMALALVLGFTQCKKEQPVPQSENQAEGVRITLNLGDDNSKVLVTPGFYNTETGETYAKVEFETGDVVYVGNNGAYCGYLEYNGSTNKFEGEVTPTSEDDYLHFYFMGNKGAKSQPSSVSITDQTSKYPVISYARSTKKYTGEGAYSAKLQNYCSMVKFTTTNIDADITITGMKNTVAVNFGANNAADGTGVGNNPYTPSKTGDGEIKLHKVSNTERWAILLPQSQVTTSMAFATGYATKSAFTVPEVTANMYHNTGVAVNLVAGYFFQVSASKVVQFSSGNLQYKSGTGWRFAQNQYDYIGAWNTSNYVDLFGWGTWGSGKNPLQTSGSYTWSTDFQGTLGGHNDWYTLSSSEWNYLFNHNTYGKATVNSKHGVIILPLGSSLSINTNHSGWSDNTINASTWTSTYEAAGAVFLPAAGDRDGTSVIEVGDYGYYWSSSRYDNYEYEAYGVEITGSGVGVRQMTRGYGFSVRLVR